MTTGTTVSIEKVRSLLDAVRGAVARIDHGDDCSYWHHPDNPCTCGVREIVDALVGFGAGPDGDGSDEPCPAPVRYPYQAKCETCEKDWPCTPEPDDPERERADLRNEEARRSQVSTPDAATGRIVTPANGFDLRDAANLIGPGGLADRLRSLADELDRDGA